MSLKKYLLPALATVLVIISGGCKNQTNEPEPEGIDRPGWKLVTNPDYTGSMTITCVLPGTMTTSEDDELAAFIDGVCRGEGSLIGGIWYLGVIGPENTLPMEIRYYSATERTIRTLSTTYIPDSRLGTTDDPCVLPLGGTEAAARRLEIRCATENEPAEAPARINRGETDSRGNNALVWHDGEQVVLLYGNGMYSLSATNLSADGTCATLTGIVSGTGRTATLCYPATTTRSGQDFSYTIPAIQYHEAGNFAHGLMPMYGDVTWDDSAEGLSSTMHALASALCFSLCSSGDPVPVDSIVIVRHVSELYPALSGGFTVSDGTVTGASGSNTASVRLVCSPAVSLSDVEQRFYFVLPSVTLYEGTTFSVYSGPTPLVTKTLKSPVNLGIAKTVNLPSIDLKP